MSKYSSLYVVAFAALLVGSPASGQPKVAEGERGVVIDPQQRFPCKGVLVAGSMFEPEPGQALFDLKGKLVDATGKPLAGKVLSLWPLSADGIFGISFLSSKGNPEVKTDASGTFALRTPAIVEDLKVVVGLPVEVDGGVCGIIPVRKDGEVWKIRLTSPSAAIDLGTITVK